MPEDAVKHVSLAELANTIPEIDPGTRRHLASLAVGKSIACTIIWVIAGNILVAATYAWLTYPLGFTGDSELSRQASALAHEAWMKSVMVFLRPVDGLVPVVSALLGYVFGSQSAGKREK